MKVRCAICGFEGEVESARLKPAPMLAFFCHRRPRTVTPDIWICDIHRSEVRD
jgi:hypothetical protein